MSDLSKFARQSVEPSPEIGMLFGMLLVPAHMRHQEECGPCSTLAVARLEDEVHVFVLDTEETAAHVSGDEEIAEVLAVLAPDDAAQIPALVAAIRARGGIMQNKDIIVAPMTSLADVTTILTNLPTDCCKRGNPADLN